MKERRGISEGGRISTPAAIRRRWGTSTVSTEDLGDRIVTEPAPDDPIAAADGALAAEYSRIDVVDLRGRALPTAPDQGAA